MDRSQRSRGAKRRDLEKVCKPTRCASRPVARAAESVLCCRNPGAIYARIPGANLARNPGQINTFTIGRRNPGAISRPESRRKSRPDSGNINPIFSRSRLGRSIHAAPDSGRHLRPDYGREIAPDFRAEIKRFDIGHWNPGAIKRGVPSTFSGGWSVRRSRFLHYEYKRQVDWRFFFRK